MVGVLADTGPLVALLRASDRHHAWARRQFELLPPPLFVCEAVISETSFLMRRAGFDPGLPVRLVERGALRAASLLDSPEDAVAVGRLMRRYRNVPMAFADACLVRLAGKLDRASILTLDSDFRIYRREDRGAISLIMPP